MMIRRNLFRHVSSVSLIGLMLIGNALAQVTYPSKPIEIFVHSRPGSGVDILARTIAKILAEEKIVTQPITVVNKTGGGGANAIAYANRKKGDPYTLWVPSSNFATTEARGLPDVKFTPVALLEAEYPVLAVRTNSPYKTVQDLIRIAKAKPGQITLGIGTLANPDHQAATQLAKAGGVEFNYVLLQGGAQVVISLLAGDIDFNFGDYVEIEGHVKTGTLRLLGVGAPKRLTHLPDLPTMTELGYPVIQETLRGVVMPADIPAETLTYWQNALEKMVKTQTWRNYLTQGRKSDVFATGENFKRAFEKLAEREAPIIRAIRKQ